MFNFIFLAILAAITYFAFYFEATLTNEMIGRLFIAGISGCLVLFLLFKFGLHYKIQSLNNYIVAFYYSVFEYKQAQTEPSGLSYMDSVREQAEVALAANFDPTLGADDVKIPVSLIRAGCSPYSGRDPFLKKLRARIQEAEKLKIQARHLNSKAEVLLDKTQDDLVEKKLVRKWKSTSPLDAMFDIEKGVAAIIDLTVGELKDQSYGRTPEYEIITNIALDNNPYFRNTYRFFDSEDVAGILARAPFMIILLGIIGTFAGFFLALNQGGDIKSGAAVAIISSLVGLPVSLLMDYINTLFPDRSRYQQAFDKFKVSLEMLFNHEQELDSVKRDRKNQWQGAATPVRE